jgi:DNA ligase-associated metallophosphoesterase
MPNERPEPLLRALEATLAGERVLLHPGRAVIWPARSTLLIADPHFGKDDIFRRAGIALPRGPAIADLQRLTELITAHACMRLVILGDFVHGATQAGDSFLHAFRLWRQAHANLIIDIVAGNHDRHESSRNWQSLANWHVRPLVEPPFVFAHQPTTHPQGYVLAGHLHPVLSFRRKGGAGRVPVFWERRESLILPSFGSFTGGAECMPDTGDTIYVAAPEGVLRLPRVTR